MLRTKVDLLGVAVGLEGFGDTKDGLWWRGGELWSVCLFWSFTYILSGNYYRVLAVLRVGPQEERGAELLFRLSPALVSGHGPKKRHKLSRLPSLSRCPRG